ncbi:MAG: ParA family protein [Acidimicrobiales bacterium]|nr:ParA family protein [Acidimicrobiales bacterium]
MRVIAAYSIKGGVGKTTTAVNLAYLSAVEGARTLVWDLDPQGAASYMFRVKPRVKGGGRRLVRGRLDVDSLIRGTDFDRLDLLPADLSYRHMDLHLDTTKRPTRQLARVLAPVRDQYDTVVLDCPPSLSLVSESVFEAAARVLVPMVPAPLPARTLDQLQAFLKAREMRRPPKVMAFFTMVDRRRKLHREIITELAGTRPEVLAAEVPASTTFEQMGMRQAPVEIFAPRSSAAAAYRKLWDEIRDQGEF